MIMNDTVQQQNGNKLKTGIAGSLIAAVCCFTPVLVISFSAVGLTGLIGGIDYVVFPVLFASLGLVAYALYLRSGNKGISPKPIIAVLIVMFSGLLIWLEFRYALRISLAAVALVAVYGYYLRTAKTPVAS